MDTKMDNTENQCKTNHPDSCPCPVCYVESIFETCGVDPAVDSRRILRSNGSDEDLKSLMDEDHIGRVLSYPIKKIRKPQCCLCKSASANGGVAPLIRLNSGRDMPGFGLGTWLGIQKTTDESAVETAVGWAIDAGYRHIDTASIYNTETEVGRAVNKKIDEGVVTRDELFITTKLWNDRHKRSAVVSALRESLNKLNLTYVDLYLIHWPMAIQENNFEETDYLETWRGMVEARDLGLARSVGVSNFNVEQLRRLMALSTEIPAVLQVEINLNLQQPDLLALCRRHAIAVVGYTPFGSLFHNKAAADAPPPRTDEQALLQIANKYGKTVPQVALRYLVELGVTPIPKSVTKKRIQQNIDIFDFELTAAERDVMKGYDRGYRTILPKFWENAKYYPFEKSTN